MTQAGDATTRVTDPTDPTDLTDLIRTVAPRLTGALREVADTVLADPAEAARLSAVALAARAGVSQASVTRFAQSIGLASHAELRLALAEQKGRSTAPGVAMDVGVQIHPDDSVRQVIKVVANADIRAITQTVNQLDHHALDLASRAIAAAQRVDVYGIGSSASVAYELETRLFRVGVRVRAWTEVHEALTSAALLTPDDVAIAISHSGATSEVVEPLRLAADRGAVTVGLTGDPRSAVAAASLHMLTTAALETSYRNGSLAARHSQMMIADCLYIRVVQLTPERAAESMALTEHIAPSHAVAARRSRVRQDSP
jgi:DNA-binding MurR/RpiR family transcriptional regulator